MPHGAGSCALFQSTRPVRGGTYTSGVRDTVSKFQSTRPVRGGTTVRYVGMGSGGFQSTRPVRGGTLNDMFWGATKRFQSTRPVRGGTSWFHHNALFPELISIHPPRAGRDAPSSTTTPKTRHFNPPAPCGAGPSTVSVLVPLLLIFQSTRPVRGGTMRKHTPKPCTRYFNPPAPCGAGPSGGDLVESILAISIHPPRAGRDPPR